MKSKKNILFVTIDGGGNLPPVLGLAEKLHKRGYQVSVLTEPCLEELIISLGYQFIPFQQHFTRKDRKEDIFKDSNVSPIKNPVLNNIVFGPAAMVSEETMEAIQQSHANLLVADCLLPTALIAAEANGIPGVLAFHMPEYFPGSNRPPGMFGLTPGKGAIGRLRDGILARLFHMKLNQFLPAINESRSRLNLPWLKQTSDLVHGADLRVIQTLERFDFPLEPRPANVRYTGPFLNEPDWTEPWTNPWPKEDSRPMVVISLSSTFQNQYAAIQSAIDALRNQNLRGLVTLGPVLQKDSLMVPENVIVMESAPHSEAFPEADLVITHAGHGTIMRSLSHGLPLVCLPMGRDQNDNAKKVEHHGCGIALTAKAGPAKIRKAVQQILSQETYKEAATNFEAEIRASDHKNQILREIEDLMDPHVESDIRLEEASFRSAL
jgi:MGT family glycosyltransferase